MVTDPQRTPIPIEPMARALLDALPGQACLLDADGGIVAVNANWERLARGSGGQLAHCGLGVNYLDVCRAAGGRGLTAAAQALSGIGEVLGGRRESFSLEYPCHTPERPQWFLMRAVALHVDPVKAVVVHDDVTEKKLGQRALHESEFRLRAVIDTAADGIISIDDWGTIDTFNAAAERLFGYERSEVIGKNVSMLMPVPDRAKHDEHLGRLRAGGPDRSLGRVRQVMARARDGTVFPVELSIGRVDSLNLYTAIVRDVSERRAMQEQLLTIAEQEQRRIGQDLHDDVGQELTGLGLMVESLAEALVEGNSPEARLADRIREGLRRLQEGMRDLCRGLMPVEVDAEGLMAALDDLALRFGASHAVSCGFECREPVRVEDNPTATHLYRIAQEAVSNAVRHGRPRAIAIRLSEAAGRVRLEVCDDGTGLRGPDAHASAGMGLRIMRYRAALIGATLTVEPVEAGGTRIVCELRGRQGDDTRLGDTWHL